MLGNLPNSAHAFTLLVPFLFLTKPFFLLCCRHGPCSPPAEDVVIFGFVRQKSSDVLQT